MAGQENLPEGLILPALAGKERASVWESDFPSVLSETFVGAGATCSVSFR